MITIDLVDEHPSQTRTSRQEAMGAGKWRLSGFDPAFRTACDVHEQLLRRAQQERQIPRQQLPERFETGSIAVLRQIVQAFIAWL